MATVSSARQPYAKRSVPQQYDAGWLNTELGNVQRASAPSGTTTVVAAYTAIVTDNVILANATGGAFGVTLPSAANVAGMQVTIKKIDASANAVTVTGTVDGAANPTLPTQYKAMTVISDGTNWYKLSAL